MTDPTWTVEVWCRHGMRQPCGWCTAEARLADAEASLREHMALVKEAWGERDEAKAALRGIHAKGCPTYRDTSDGLTRHDALCCCWCDANLDAGEPHDYDCAWTGLAAALKEGA